jgi:hypothetical protein
MLHEPLQIPGDPPPHGRRDRAPREREKNYELLTAPALAALVKKAARSRWEDALEAQMRAALLAPLEAAGLTVRREYVFAPPRKWRFDFAILIPPASPFLGIEVEGGVWTNGRHNRGAGFEEDARKYGEAVVLGYRVLRVTPSMVKSGEALALIERAIRLAPVAQAFGPGELAERSPR